MTWSGTRGIWPGLPAVQSRFDARQAPIKDLSHLKELAVRLRANFSRAQVEGVMGENWLDFLSRSLPD
jgi:microsomal dipeptidase-like Zn-dependent dipeptidase